VNADNAVFQPSLTASPQWGHFVRRGQAVPHLFLVEP